MKSFWNQFRMDRVAVALSLIGILALYRILPHPDNFTPFGALALFGGAIWGRSSSWAFIVPLSALFLSDLILGLHSTMVFVYAGAILGVLLGSLLHSKRSFGTLLGVSLLNSIIFFIVSNFGVWVMENLYPRTLEGLGTCYVAALPFFRYTFVSDLVFTFLAFGIFALVFKESKPGVETSSLKTVY